MKNHFGGVGGIRMPPSAQQAGSSYAIWFSKTRLLDKNIIQKDTCTPMFIAALFIIAKMWEEPKSSLTDEWIKNMWYIYTMEYYSAIRRMKNNILQQHRDYHAKWSQSERERQIHYDITYRWNLKHNINEHIISSTIVWAQVKQQGGNTALPINRKLD